jgi:signal transduction histidine kinase/CheY-like chemotaxis protein
MKLLVVADLCARLGAAPDLRAARSILADAFVREWGADAAIVWLPNAEAGQPDDELCLSGDLVGTTAGDLYAGVKENRVDGWLSDRGYQTSCVVDLQPPGGGRLALAWRAADAAPAQTTAVLTLVAACVSIFAEKSRCEERLASATTALLEAEDQIARTRRVRALGEMASGVAHDFNNSLTSILGFTELALGPLEEGDAFFSDLSSIRMAALDAAALVRRLQSFGRKGRGNDERELVDLREVARVMPAFARPRWQQLSQCEGITFEVVVDVKPVPPIFAVVAEIRELLLNLLFNAVDAMPRGGRITIATAQADDGWAVVSVTDQGVGMTEEVSRRIFLPFFSTKGDRGSGLGLSVCQKIAARHGARLEVASTPGVGTTFTLRVPPAPPDVQATVVPRAADVAPAGQRVVLADDDAAVRDTVGEMLRAMGHDVTVVDSGESAVALAGRQRVDVVITDVGMPGMNGIEVAQRFRVLAPRVPVILLTGWGVDQDTVRPANVVAVLGKPVSMKTLRDALTACAAEDINGWSEKCS